MESTAILFRQHESWNVAEREIVGRDPELGAITWLLDSAPHHPTVLALLGEAGIGKTTQWAAGAEEARTRHFTVLSSRPASAEIRLSYAGLTDATFRPATLRFFAGEIYDFEFTPRRPATCASGLHVHACFPDARTWLGVEVRPQHLRASAERALAESRVDCESARFRSPAEQAAQPMEVS